MPTVQLITPRMFLCPETKIAQSGVHTIITGRSVTGDNKRKLNSTLNVSLRLSTAAGAYRRSNASGNHWNGMTVESALGGVGELWRQSLGEMDAHLDPALRSRGGCVERGVPL
ncbi:hypothetical protein BDV39DRAFT_172198, partial [Aspergillus sergii]